MENLNIITLELDVIRQSYEQYRLADQTAQNKLTESISCYGQISPVVICSSDKDGEYELIDGFKRLRACRKLEIKTIKARLLEVGIRSRKAAIIKLNWVKQTVKPFEEALILHSLINDDGLTQVELCKLFARHASWVSRRISLVQRLCEEVQEQIKLGLIPISIGRELAKLPRGKQEDALGVIRKYVFNCRETERLVDLLMTLPRPESEALLAFPQLILDERMPPKPSKKSTRKKSDKELIRLEKKLGELMNLCNIICLMVDKVKSNDDCCEKETLEKATGNAIYVSKNCVSILEDFNIFLNEPPF